MKIRMFLLIVLVSAVLTGCDDTTSPDKDEDFILAVMVLDPVGQPLEGMSVGRQIDLEGFDLPWSRQAGPGALLPDSDTLMFSYPNPFNGVAAVRFFTVDTREAQLYVIDWRGREVKTLLQGRLMGGLYSIEWDQRDGAGDRVINGVYRFCLALADTLDPHEYDFADSIECTVIDFLDPNRTEIDVTDHTGFFSTRDLDLFPSLQGHGIQTIYNEVAEPTGDFSVSDTLTIMVSTPPPAEGGRIYHMRRRVVLVDGPNYLEFHFVPNDSSGVFINSP